MNSSDITENRFNEENRKYLHHSQSYGVEELTFVLTVCYIFKSLISLLGQIPLQEKFPRLRLISRFLFGLLLSTLLVFVSAPWFMLMAVIRFSALAFVRCDFDVPQGMDMTWASKTMEEDSKIIAVFYFERRVNIADIRKRFEDVITTSRDASGKLLYKRMTQIFVALRGYYVWKTVDDFRIEDHIREIQLETAYEQEILDDANDSGFIGRYLDDFGHAPFAKGKPLWDITFINREKHRLEFL